MRKINDKLAVHGFDWDWEKMEEIKHEDDEYEEYNYGVITDDKFDKTKTGLDGWIVLDCRILLDDRFSPLNHYKTLINIGCELLKSDAKVVCCCSAGQSRSNAIALGLLVDFFGMNFYDAWELVKEKNRYSNIAMQHIDALKEIFGVTIP